MDNRRSTDPGRRQKELEIAGLRRPREHSWIDPRSKSVRNLRVCRVIVRLDFEKVLLFVPTHHDLPASWATGDEDDKNVI